MNIILCSHCDFLGNSAFHVYALAKALRDEGHDCVLAIPGDLATAPKDSPIPIMSYADVKLGGLVFDDGRSPDLVHAWTPRAHVVELVQHIVADSRCRYIVHMEDNEDVIVARELPPTVSLEELKHWPFDLVEHILANPARTNVSSQNMFLARANGFSCLTDRLLEFSPKGVPSCVIAPGFDPIFEPLQDRAAARSALGLSDDQLVVTYCGNVHSSNLDDMRSLYAALALVGRRRGDPVILLRSGWDQVPFEVGDPRGLDIRTFGFVDRERLPPLVHAADILVQPGRVDAFNAYRFPSKAPDYLVSGRPLILPDTNIGLSLIDGEQAIKLKVGDAFDIAACVEKLADDKVLQDRVGSAGRRFARQELSWAKAARRLDRLYRDVLSQPLKKRTAKTPQSHYPVTLAALLEPDFPPSPTQRARLAAAGVQIIISSDALEVIAPSGPADPSGLLLDGSAFQRRWSEQIAEGADYMIAAAQAISALERPDAVHAFVGAPDERLEMASVAAYAQWLRLAVRHAYEATNKRCVIIAGLGPILETGLGGDRRGEAVLRATRLALVNGVSLGVRRQTVQDEADFLAATTYRSDAK